MTINPPVYRIGVDVGGTNTDAVIVDTSVGDHARSVIASHKSPTTSPNVTAGIERAVRSVLSQSRVDPDRVSSIAVGTTHFINAIVEHDARHLERVAVLRLSRSFTREVPPFSDFPAGLRRIMHGYHAFLDGGLHIDGSLEAPVRAEQVRRECEAIRERGIRCVAVVGVFAPLDSGHLHQEEAVRAIVNRQLPEVAVVCSHEVSGLGFLERENATILNASILRFAARTIGEFRKALARLGLRCPLHLTQNDGTMIEARSAARLPIRTFSSGPTNSMRGAAYLSGMYEDGKAGATSIVCDVGGTTSDVGVLLPSGYPRQGVAEATVARVRVNYSMPHVESIGLGGGSVVREMARGGVSVGPDSVGHAIQEKGLVFGGDVMTATDVAVAAGAAAKVGDRSLVDEVDQKVVSDAQAVIRKKLERAIDLVKTSPDDVPLILVGGGSIIAPDTLAGVSRVIRPPHHDVANAVGAAVAKVSAVVDMVKDTADQSVSAALAQAVQLATERAVAAGAQPHTVVVTEKEVLPIPYVANQFRLIVKTVGEFSPSREAREENGVVVEAEPMGCAEEEVTLGEKTLPVAEPEADEVFDIESYRPCIRKNATTGVQEWFLSATDLEWLSDGCYVLGCGGGGSPYPEMLKLKSHLEAGHTLRVIDPEDLAPDARLYWPGFMGSTVVPAERLSASETILAVKLMMEHEKVDDFDALIGLEIGGANGLQPLTVGSSKNFDKPAVDADWMGRAYPTMWQTTISAQVPDQLIPCGIASGDGRNLLMTRTDSDRSVDRTLRAASTEMGCYVGWCPRPTTGALVRRWAVPRTLSQAWRVGRCIARAAATNTASTVVDAIVEQLGGPACAKLLFRGKIVHVERRLYKGHSHGEVTIAHQAEADEEGEVMRSEAAVVGGTLRIPFKNENILATHEDRGVVACVPDLIAVLDAGTGRALGVGEYRYGVAVNVLGVTCAPAWSENAAALEVGGPAAFDRPDVVYEPLGTYVEPESVIREFQTS
ncbi:hypothetical protein ISF_05534 [Cordyceps fumosorosea ARSEF 2679]|uniref:Hydantoinase n=1 Tax=Cordyceps fumosorosea (strain ARSEF 2679) TaxID=1081104 RepID=A0A167UCQ3_CORFA|nr:hypothetical protein ISF_05534 [Cordyceps fumosorosea ARSEF 2679]OAA61455.1 hypothetical protein ISF_05534 [Cordyceps fumosorosea ARSEF 2679]